MGVQLYEPGARREGKKPTLAQNGDGSCSAAKCEDKVEDGSSSDIEIARSLIVWPIFVLREQTLESVKNRGARSQDCKLRDTHICRPPKINRCCGGGTPDCSSTFSLMRVIWIASGGVRSMGRQKSRGEAMTMKGGNVNIMPRLQASITMEKAYGSNIPCHLARYRVRSTRDNKSCKGP